MFGQLGLNTACSIRGAPGGENQSQHTPNGAHPLSHLLPTVPQPPAGKKRKGNLCIFMSVWLISGSVSDAFGK